MCMACGQMFSNIHWSDRQRVDERGFVDQRQLFRTRLMKVNFTNEVLRFYGLSVSSRAGGGYTVSNRTGKSILCKDFGDLWPQVQKLCGKTDGPLDLSLIAYLQQRAAE